MASCELRKSLIRISRRSYFQIWYERSLPSGHTNQPLGLCIAREIVCSNSIRFRWKFGYKQVSLLRSLSCLPDICEVIGWYNLTENVCWQSYVILTNETEKRRVLRRKPIYSPSSMKDTVRARLSPFFSHLGNFVRKSIPGETVKGDATWTHKWNGRTAACIFDPVSRRTSLTSWLLYPLVPIG